MRLNIMLVAALLVATGIVRFAHADDDPVDMPASGQKEEPVEESAPAPEPIGPLDQGGPLAPAPLTTIDGFVGPKPGRVDGCGGVAC